MVKKTMGYPLHVHKLLKSGLLINCGDERCQEEMAIPAQLGMNERECSHLMLVYNAFYPQPASSGKYRVLSEETCKTLAHAKRVTRNAFSGY